MHSYGVLYSHVVKSCIIVSSSASLQALRQHAPDRQIESDCARWHNLRQIQNAAASTVAFSSTRQCHWCKYITTLLLYMAISKEPRQMHLHNDYTSLISARFTKLVALGPPRLPGSCDCCVCGQPVGVAPNCHHQKKTRALK
jgi:hypothetical protein